jgi:hypothetical protein
MSSRCYSAFPLARERLAALRIAEVLTSRLAKPGGVLTSEARRA